MQLYDQRHKTAYRALQGCFLRLCLFYNPRYQTDTNGYNTICDTLESIHAPGRAQPIPDTTATPGHCTGQHRPPIIIRYIRGQTMPAAAGQLLPCADRWQVLTHCQQCRPCAPAEGSASPPVNLARVSPAGSRCFPRPAACSLAPGQRSGRGDLVPSTRRGSPAAGGAAGGAEQLAACAASLFGLSPDS